MEWAVFLISCKQSVKVALVVGTLLSLVNQSEAIFDLAFDAEAVVHILANYLIPFLVATYSRMALLREQVVPAENDASGGSR